MESMQSHQGSASLFNERHSVAIRIWHWTFFLMLAASVITVLLTSTLFTTRGNVQLVQEQILQKGGTVTPIQARAVAHAFSDKLWKLHILIGYALSFLLLSRIVIEVSHSKEERLKNKIRKALTFSSENEGQKQDKRHYLFVKYGYLVFYLLILIMVITGLGLAFEQVPFLRILRLTLGTVHSFTQYLIYLYILIHLTGVIRADLTDNKGLVSRMIHGSTT